MSCNDNIINLNEGAQGDPGISSYTYIGYADTNTGTNFSLTPLPSSKYVAFKSDNVLFTPTVTYFAGLWTLYKGADGVGSAGINIELNNTPVTSGVTTINFAGAGLSGVTVADAGSNQTDVTIVTAGLIKLTRAQALTLIATSGFIIGGIYWIYDVLDGVGTIGANNAYAGVILKAITVNSLDTEGTMIARIVNRTAVSSRYSDTATYGISALVEDTNEVYLCLNPVVGAVPSVSITSGNWQYVERSNNTYYNTEIHGCSYSVVTNVIISRWDYKGNKVNRRYNPFSTNTNASILRGFRWGVTDFFNNTIDLYNNEGVTVDRGDIAFSSFQLYKYAYCYDTTIINSSILGGYSNTSFNINQSIIKNSIISLFNTAFISKCIINESIISLSLASYITRSDLFFTNITHSLSNIDYIIGTFEISNNIGCTFNNLKGNIIIGDNTNCSFDNIYNNLRLQNNIGCIFNRIQGTSSATTNNTIEYCENITMLDNILGNGVIKYCISTGSAASKIIQYCSISNNSEISFVNFLNVANIKWCNLTNQSKITNWRFETAVTIPDVSSGNGTLQYIDISNIVVDGNNSALAGQATTLLNISSGTEKYEYLNININNSSAYSFLDMSTHFAAGVLTIPTYAHHSGIIYLYNCNGQTITSIIKSTNNYFPITFKYIEGPGTVTFTRTAFASLSGGNFTSDTASQVLTNYADQITFKKLNGYFHKINSTIVL